MAFLLLGPLIFGFVWFVLNAYAPPPVVQPADGIAVLTGGAERIAEGVALLRDGYGKQLLISGVGKDADLKSIARAAQVDVRGVEGQIDLGFAATSTFGNAQEIAGWAQAHQFHSVLIVTGSYHMPRAKLQLERVAPGLEVSVMPVRAPALRGLHLSAGPVLVYEYGKFLAAEFGVLRDSAIGAAQ